MPAGYLHFIMQVRWTVRRPLSNDRVLSRFPGIGKLAHGRTNPMPTRRTMLKHGFAFGLHLAGMTLPTPRQAMAAPLASVSPPRIALAAQCMATVSVNVSLAGLLPGDRYEVRGDILEDDDPDDEPDFCCTLNPDTTPFIEQPVHTLLLTRQAMAVDLGLMRGVGPAADEALSPDLVELFARVWVQDLATGDRFGPWESPRRIAVSKARIFWTEARGTPAWDLLAPRGEPPATVPAGGGEAAPRKECAPTGLLGP